MNPKVQQIFDALIHEYKTNPEAELQPILKRYDFEPFSGDRNIQGWEHDDGDKILVSDNIGTGLPLTIGEADISLYEADSDQPIKSSLDDNK